MSSQTLSKTNISRKLSDSIYRTLNPHGGVTLHSRSYTTYNLYQSSSINRHEDIHSYKTRNASNSSLPAHHLSLYSKKTSCSGVKLFNLLTENIQNTYQDSSKTAKRLAAGQTILQIRRIPSMRIIEGPIKDNQNLN